MKINLHEPTFGEDEIQAVVDTLRSTNVTSGNKVREFESLFGEHAVMCNSGSSANLLAIAAICNPLTHNHLCPGDEVIVSALSWATTVWPLVQYGLVPVIVDIDPDTLNIDPVEIEKAISPRTKAIMPVHVYGNPCDMSAIVGIAYNYDLILIEDNCEALGADVGNDGHYSTYSFYFSHHITTLEGGMVVAKDTKTADMLRVLRAHGWTRDMVDPPHFDGIDNRFVFINAGYNLRASEVNAAIGLVQYPKLKGFVERRRLNAILLSAGMPEWVSIQHDKGSSWFGFPVTVDDNVDVKALRQHLDNNGVETRSIICGNIAKQPGMKLWPHRVVGDLKNADRVMEQGFSMPCHQGMNDDDCYKITDTMKSFT